MALKFLEEAVEIFYSLPWEICGSQAGFQVGFQKSESGRHWRKSGLALLLEEVDESTAWVVGQECFDQLYMRVAEEMCGRQRRRRRRQSALVQPWRTCNKKQVGANYFYL